MRVTIVGSGYVGLVTGACLAELGNQVICHDVDENKIQQLQSGVVPIFEPGLGELISKNSESGRLKFSSDVREAALHGEVQFLAVGTPQDHDGSADLQYVLAAAKSLGRHINSFTVIVNKSTVPVGTADLVSEAISRELIERNSPTEFSVVSNPEFLKEGSAVRDFMRPDRIILGVKKDELGSRALKIMKQLYSPFNRNHERNIVMDVKSSELTKYAANAMLATRISFMNEVANLADRVGADVELIRQGIGADERIGYDFLYAGTGFGGSCFPKDIRALINTAKNNSLNMEIVEAVDRVNNQQKQILVRRIVDFYGEDLSGKVFAIWGLAFKPNTDDMREAPSKVILRGLLSRGATVCMFDPIISKGNNAWIEEDVGDIHGWRARVNVAGSQYAALEGADALIIATEWSDFKSPDFGIMKEKLRHPVIFDGRNIYPPDNMHSLGFEYFGIGRSYQ